MSLSCSRTGTDKLSSARLEVETLLAANNCKLTVQIKLSTLLTKIFYSLGNELAYVKSAYPTLAGFAV